MNLLKDVKIWIFIIALIAAIAAIGYNPFSSGLVVTDIDPDSPLSEKISVGETISSINEDPIKGQGDIDRWNSIIRDTPTTDLLRIVHNGQVDLFSLEGDSLGIILSEKTKHNVELGMDLVGGTRVILKPEFRENITDEEKVQLTQEIVSSLETRTNVYGLKEFVIRSLNDINGDVFIEIETPGTSDQDVQSLLERQGIFEAYIPQEIINNTLIVGTKGYEMDIRQNRVFVDGISLGVNETATLNGLELIARSIENNTASIDAKVYEGRDIKFVHTDSQNSYVRQQSNGYQFVFSIVLSEEGADKFARATQGLREIGGTFDCSLSQPIVLYLDEIEVSSLNIACSLKGDSISTVQISGGRETEEDAEQEMRRLQSILKSGSLPVELTTVKVDTVSPSLGGEFLRGSILAILLSIISVSLVVFVRYRNWKVSMPMILISVSETVLILGASAVIGWTIDLASIAGIIAAVGTGVDDQIIIVDEALKRGKISRATKDRIKRAFFIVFTAAGTGIAAMLPLAFSKIAIMRGFGITTIIGILIGIFITRPAFAKMVQKIVKD